MVYLVSMHLYGYEKDMNTVCKGRTTSLATLGTIVLQYQPWVNGAVLCRAVLLKCFTPLVSQSCVTDKCILKRTSLNFSTCRSNTILIDTKNCSAILCRTKAFERKQSNAEGI